MIIYLCIKFQSNKPILSKDIAWKPIVLCAGRTDRADRWGGRTDQTEGWTAVLYALPLKMAGALKHSPSTLTCYKDSRPCTTVSQYQLDIPVTQDT